MADTRERVALAFLPGFSPVLVLLEKLSFFFFFFCFAFAGCGERVWWEGFCEASVHMHTVVLIDT